MERRSFFGLLFGGLLARFAVKQIADHRYETPWGWDGDGGMSLGHDCAKMRCGQPELCGYRMTACKALPENTLYCNAPKGHAGNHSYTTPWQHFPKPGAMTYEACYPGTHRYEVTFISRNGYITAPTPNSRLSQRPMGQVSRSA